MGRTILGVLLACLGLSALANAQTSPQQLQREARLRELQQLEIDQRLRANSAVPVGQRALFDYGGYVGVNYLSVDDSARDNHVLRQYDLVGYARLNLDGAQELFLRGSTGYRDFNDQDSFDGRGDEIIDPDLDRGYYRFDLGRYNSAYRGATANPNFTFQGGRDLVYWANGLVLAQALDGVIMNFGNERLTLQAIAGVTPVRTVDFDVSRPKFDFNTRRGFYGAMLTAGGGEHHPFIYGLMQRDYNQDDPLTLGLVSTRFGYNSYYIGAGSTGALSDRLRYGVEIAYELGNSLSNSFEVSGLGGLIPVTQTRDDIFAYGADARLDYLLPDPNQTRLSAEVIIASGDKDRGNSSATFNGNTPGTPDRAFNSFGLLNTGLAFSPEVSNLLTFRVGAATFPLPDAVVFRRLQVGTDFFVFNRLDRLGSISEQTTGASMFLGVEPDLYLNWQITSDVTLALRYGAFLPDNASFAINDVRQFFYGGVTFAF